MVVILVHAITELLFTYITSVILAVISADGELLFANVTHMVTILISALAKCLFILYPCPTTQTNIAFV